MVFTTVNRLTVFDQQLTSSNVTRLRSSTTYCIRYVDTNVLLLSPVLLDLHARLSPVGKCRGRGSSSQ